MDYTGVSHYPTVDIQQEKTKLDNLKKVVEGLNDEKKSQLAQLLRKRVKSNVFYLKSRKRIG